MRDGDAMSHGKLREPGDSEAEAAMGASRYRPLPRHEEEEHSKRHACSGFPEAFTFSVSTLWTPGSSNLLAPGLT